MLDHDKMTQYGETLYMDALLTPNRSLSPRAFTAIMIGVAGISFLAGLAFLSIGAVPVVGFFGLDALAIWFALRWHIRKSSEETQVRVTAETLSLTHRMANGREKTASIPAAFARVELDTPLTPTSCLRIEHGRTAYIIGRFLTPDERQSLAGALRAALARARGERLPA